LVDHWKARLGYWLFDAGCRLIARGARLLPSIAGWSADLSFTDTLSHGKGEVLDVEHWRGQRVASRLEQKLVRVEVQPGENPGRGGVIVDPSMPAGTDWLSSPPDA